MSLNKPFPLINFYLLLDLQEEDPVYQITAQRKERVDEFNFRKKTGAGFDLVILQQSRRRKTDRTAEDIQRKQDEDTAPPKVSSNSTLLNNTGLALVSYSLSPTTTPHSCCAQKAHQ